MATTSGDRNSMGWCQTGCQKGSALVECCADGVLALPAQFRAISMELWKTQDYHGAVRRKTVRYMRWDASSGRFA